MLGHRAQGGPTEGLGEAGSAQVGMSGPIGESEGGKVCGLTDRSVGR